MPMKKTKKQFQQEEIDNLKRAQCQYLDALGTNAIFAYLKLDAEQNLYDLDRDIEDEQSFADENPPRSTYSSAGAEARQRVKWFNKLRVEHEKKIDLLKQLIKAHEIIENWDD